MKTFVRYAVALLAITVTCQAGLALAEDYYWVGSGDQTAAPTAAEKAAPAQPQSASNTCCPPPCGCEQSCDPCDGCGCRMGCDQCPPVGLVGSFGLDSFKGIADGGASNFGAVTTLNVGVPIPGLRDYGLGWQTGISYGVYDFDGRITGTDTARSQQQTFVTTGFFRKANCDQRLSFGLVYDWMCNSEWGVYGNDPMLGQWRGQIEYAVTDCNGMGLWFAKRDLGSVQRPLRDSDLTVSNRAISQVNLFWHHKFACTCADSWLWVGIPDQGRYDDDGSLGNWTIGASVQVPLSQRSALYANGSYMHPSASASPDANIEAGWDVGFGVAWYFGGNARSCALNGKCWVPYMPVANNTNFLVEQGVSGVAN
jgi:hypothetical protein